MKQVPASIVALLCVSCGGAGVSLAPSERPPAPAPAPVNTTTMLGTFEMTFTADPACTDLPPAARSRTYTATLNLGSSRAELTGATFVEAHSPYPQWNLLYTRVDGESADLWFQDPEIWESLSDESYVVIFGDAHGRIGANVSTLPFWAKFAYCAEREIDDYPECEVPARTCGSRNHTLTLRRK